MKRKTKRQASRFERMTASELAGATASYGREMAIDDFEPLKGSTREEWTRARRRRGRPRRGKGAKVISVSVEKGLLSRSDSLARDLGVSRAGLIERGLKAVLAAEGSCNTWSLLSLSASVTARRLAFYDLPRPIPVES